MPKAELNTKNSTKRQLCCRLVEFLVFNSVHQLISVPSDEVYRVGDGGPDHAVVPQLFFVEICGILLIHGRKWFTTAQPVRNDETVRAVLFQFPMAM